MIRVEEKYENMKIPSINLAVKSQRCWCEMLPQQRCCEFSHLSYLGSIHKPGRPKLNLSFDNYLLKHKSTNSSLTSLSLTYVSHIHIKWIWCTASHLVSGDYCDDVYFPYGSVLLAEETGVGATGFVVWTFMGGFLSATSNALRVTKKPRVLFVFLID